MKFKTKKSILILSVGILAGVVTGCFNNKNEEPVPNVPQQEQQTNNNNNQVDNNQNKEENNGQVENNNQQPNSNNQGNTNNGQIENNNQSNTQTGKKISEDKALQICKEKLVGIWKPEFLKLGTNKSGIDKVVKVKDKSYYAIYHIDEEKQLVADFRFLVDQTTGEVFYQSPEDLNNLESIDKYIAKMKKYNSKLSKENNDSKNEFTPKEAIDLTLKYIGESADEKGDTFAVSDKFSMMLRSSGDAMVKNNVEYYPIEFYVPNEEGRYALSGQWYISEEGKLYHSNGSLGKSINDISNNLVNKNTLWK